MDEEPWQSSGTAPLREDVWVRLDDDSVLFAAERYDIDTWLWHDSVIPGYRVMGWRPIDWE